ncbi:MAG: outer membrane protein assembly factor BamD [Flavobacteriaceae bacterium]|nr:outer membrane protein assembly factor BamD [Flavobacteriaceae bacterium]
MKKTGTILLMALVLASCGKYHKVLNKGTIEEQYKLAAIMYDAENYSKAIPLFEKITPGYRGKPQMERIQFMISNAYYQSKQYHLSSYYFDRFAKNYPKSTKREEAAYLGAHSYYLDSPISSLDQSATNEALAAMQSFMDTYPASEKIDDANMVVQELRYKLETKAFDTAYQYYRIADYTAAITSFDDLIGDYLGTKYREEALYLKFMAGYKLSVRSVLLKKEARLREALTYYEKFIKSYSNSEYLSDMEKPLEEINKEIAAFEEWSALLNK